MTPESIPEDREESYPCPECDGNVTKKGVIWACDKCDFSFLAEEPA